MKTQFSLSHASNDSASIASAVKTKPEHVSKKVDRPLSIEEASVMTERFRHTIKPGSRKAGFFGRNIIEKILSQEDCFGIRAYFAAEENGALTFVLVGLNAQHREMTTGVLGEDTLPCPPYCGQLSPLNADLVPFVKARNLQASVFTGNENHRVTLAEAKRLIRNFDGTDACGIVGSDISKRSLFRLLQHEESVGIRMYFGRQIPETLTVVFVGASAVGEDLLHGPIFEGKGVRLEQDVRCRTLG